MVVSGEKSRTALVRHDVKAWLSEPALRCPVSRKGSWEVLGVKCLDLSGRSLVSAGDVLVYKGSLGRDDLYRDTFTIPVDVRPEELLVRINGSLEHVAPGSVVFTIFRESAKNGKKVAESIVSFNRDRGFRTPRLLHRDNHLSRGFSGRRLA